MPRMVVLPVQIPAQGSDNVITLRKTPVVCMGTSYFSQHDPVFRIFNKSVISPDWMCRPTRNHIGEESLASLKGSVGMLIVGCWVRYPSFSISTYGNTIPNCSSTYAPLDSANRRPPSILQLKRFLTPTAVACCPSAVSPSTMTRRAHGSSNYPVLVQGFDARRRVVYYQVRS